MSVSVVTLLPLFFLLVGWCFCSGGVSGLTISAQGESTSGVMWGQCSDAFPYKTDNVLLSYKQVPLITSAWASLASGAASFVSCDGEQPQDLVPPGTLQLPVAAHAIIIVYNVPNVTASLTLDGPTLSRIWSGNITKYNDPQLTALNPGLPLPDHDIILAYVPTDDGISTLFKRALASFDDAFKSANFSFDDLLPVSQNRTYRAANMIDRLTYTVNNKYVMTYVERSNTYKRRLPLVNMINKAGNNITLNATAAKSAMDDYSAVVRSGNLVTDVFNGPGALSWPMTFVIVAATRQEFNASVTDCTTVSSMADIFSWMQVNNQISTAIARGGAFTLTTVYYKRMIDGLGSIKCGGVRAFNSSYLIGEGTAINTVSDWIQGYNGNTFTQKYFSVPSVKAIEDLDAGDIDFAIGLPSGVSMSNKRSVENLDGVEAFPGAAAAVIPVYNIPELQASSPLVLSIDVLAAIYLGRVTSWNDPLIQALNPDVVLPEQQIVAIITTSSSTVTSAFTNALAKRSQEFNATVGSNLSVTFPIQALNHTISGPYSIEALLELAGLTPYSLTWTLSGNINANIAFASLLNTAGTQAVAATASSVYAAVSDLSQTSIGVIGQFTLSTHPMAWPIVTSLPFLLRLSSETLDCLKTKTLINWIYWTQTEGQAFLLAEGSGTISAGQVPFIQRSTLSSLSAIMCEGEHMLSVWACISDGLVCSNHGRCVDNQCACFSGYGGNFCEQTFQAATSSSDNLALILGIVIPISVALCLLLLCLILAVVCFTKYNRKNREEWNLNWDELDMGEPLGAGGYGEVFKAKWRGTEVAVKMVASTTQVTKEMQKFFADEIHVMTTLRHPNVVLFMAASTKPPKMCIVMEFMALGSLYDLLHNELIPEIPFKLKVKMAFQAAKGMHFLHSSGIVHRDLKSLNLLLDAKWNVKVSDFGLTTFKSNIKKGGAAGVATVHWSAPEVLNECHDVDYILADVYSFGIILWELLTREQPYSGMSPAAVAVAVIRNNTRPTLPSLIEDTDRDFADLMQACWHEDPTIRPTFLEIMTRLSSFDGGMSRSSYTSHSSSSSSMSSTTDHRTNKLSHHSGRSSSTASSGGDGSSGGGDSTHGSGVMVPHGLRAPDGEVAIVFSDITRAASLWEHDPAAMRDATAAHNDLLRSLAAKYGGYEGGVGRERNTGEGSFCLVFVRAFDALRWCVEAQNALLAVAWPESLLSHPGAAEEVDGGMDERTVFRGLRVRMGVHVGHPRVVKDAMTRRVEYVGSVVNTAARMTALAHGGQVVVSQQVSDKLAVEVTTVASTERLLTELAEEKRLKKLGRFEMPDMVGGATLYEMKVPGLEGRYFGRMALQKGYGDNDNSNSSSSVHSDDGSMRDRVGEAMAYKEDHFLTSANLCRWVIDFKEIQLGDQVGMGSYGMVYKGMWKGVEVAVKKFIQQKLDERRMLEFRAEMAFLSELHHPNIVLFIGSCVKRPNLCIVTEFVKRGSLKEIAADHTIKLSWPLKLHMLKSAALGINYLHSLSPVIVHRDIKPSNLLVDENWNVKVADFGFARIKEENVTMTRCGTPCWTAPEVIRGEKYCESADVYSFGVVMWEVAARKQPFAGCNFMAVAIEVLEGRRPKIPADLPPIFKKLIKRCWHRDQAKRPTMEEVISTLDDLKGITTNQDKV